MEMQYERKLQINEWIINARWFYMVAVFLIGILGNSLIGVLGVKVSFFSVGMLLLVFIFINAFFYHTLTTIKKTKSVNKLKWLSLWQIVIELVVFTVVMHLGGDKALASVFFFLPIISASIIFGVRGAVMTAIVAAGLVNFFIVFDYFDYLFKHIITKDAFKLWEITEFKYQTISIIKTIATSNLYLVIAIFSGYGARFLYQREQQLIARAEDSTKIRAYRENELKQLDKTTKLLVKRDMAISAVNKELDKKIEELEKSEKAMLKAFADLKDARKKAEEESNKTASIIANFIDPIIVIDEAGRLSLLNSAATDIFGLIDSDLGRKVSRDNNYSMENFKKIIKIKYGVKTSKELKSQNLNEEEVVIQHDKQELTYKVITAGVVDKENNHLGTMKIFYNLTREKMLDKLKSEFISIAAHQLRTPLSAIKWVIKMVLDGDTGKLNDEQQKMLYRGYQSNERIIELVNDMLNVSRIEEGRFGYSFVSCDFNQTLDIVINSLENKIKSKNINFVVDIPKKMAQVYMDKQKMTLVLQNLLENAVKYTPVHGTIKVSVEVGRKLLQFKIKDNGVGIPKKDQEKLFSKFFRAENVVRMQTEGSGLGLFIVKNIIEKHGGDIIFNSQEGKGTEFVFKLPFN